MYKFYKFLIVSAIYVILNSNMLIFPQTQPSDTVNLTKEDILNLSYDELIAMPYDEFSQRAGYLLKQGVSIIAFPEGTRSANKVLGHFHGSLFRLALKEKCPLIPVCISGNENIPKKGSLLLHPGIIKIHKLPALAWSEYKHLAPFKLKNYIRDIMAKELAIMDAMG